jgi:phage repressor protein C with HTH and peptisase S24 domain
MNWHTRLTEARLAKNLKKNAFAKLVGVSPATITQWENGETKKIEGSNLIRACQILDITPAWLLHNDGSPTGGLAPFQVPALPEDSADRYYYIKKVRLRLSAGMKGVQIDAEEYDGSTMGIDRNWVKKNGFQPDMLLAVEIHGESMEPSLHEGDTVVVNTADVHPVDGAVFAINYEGEPLVKRLSRDAGDWWLTSDNSDQRRFHRKVCRGDSCILVGRVVLKESERI